MKKLFLTSWAIFCFFVASVAPATAYYTNMPASIVVGQPDFTSASANQGGTAKANTLFGPSNAIIADGKLLIYDFGNRRLLIWNSVPTQNNAPADVVVGQTDMTSTAGGCSASKLNPGDSGILYAEGKLIIADAGNNRVLIFNSIPKTNGASADVVIGQTSMTTCLANKGGSPSSSTLSSPSQIAYANGKLFIVDTSNQRVLIYNSIPTTNNTSADVVVGQPNFSSSSTGTSATALSNPRGIAISGGKMLVGIRSTFRIHIWNTIPTTNGAAADVVLGQTSFTANVSSPPSTASTVHPFFIHVDEKGRLYSADRNASRYLIWNQIPAQNNQPADIVIGQPDFTSSTTNNGGVSARSLGLAKSVFVQDGKMVALDGNNNRVLIFYDTVSKPGLALENKVEGKSGGILSMKGSVSTEHPYSIQNVEYSVNGSGWYGASPTEGNFNENIEEYYFDFDKTQNNQSNEGFVIQVKARNNNADEVDRLTYFEPFRQNTPENNSRTDNQQPVFSFTVNSQRQLLYEGLQKYMIMVKKGREDWTLYADEIPVNYEYAKDKAENVAEKKYGTNGNGIYEDSKIKVTYSEDGSRLEVYSKEDHKKLTGGSYQWKVVAVDKGGHTQETSSRYIRMSGSGEENWFPLTIDSISGVGKVSISSINPETTKPIYYTAKNNPSFSGVAFAGAAITLELTDQLCRQQIQSNCVQTFSTTADLQSRFSLLLPEKVLLPNKKYLVAVFVTQEEKYADLPPFEIVYSSETTFSTNREEAVLGLSTEIEELVSATISATPKAEQQQNKQPNTQAAETGSKKLGSSDKLKSWWLALVLIIVFIFLIWKSRKKSK